MMKNLRIGLSHNDDGMMTAFGRIVDELENVGKEAGVSYDA
jgi:hypothetical protein